MSIDKFLKRMALQEPLVDAKSHTVFKEFLKSQIGKVRTPDSKTDIPETNLYRCLYYNSYEKKASYGSDGEKMVLAKDIVFYADDVLYKTHYVGKEVFEVGKTYKIAFTVTTIEEAKKDKPPMMVISRIRNMK